MCSCINILRKGTYIIDEYACTVLYSKVSIIVQ